MTTPPPVAVTFINGRPVVLIADTSLAATVAGLVYQHDQTATWRGELPIEHGAAFVAAARRAEALALLVPQTEPEHASQHPIAGRWITTQQAAQLLHISERAIRKRAAKGHLGSRRTGGRWLIDATLLATPDTEQDTAA